MKINYTFPTCGGTKLVKNGFRKQKQCFLCKDCGRQFIIRKKDVRLTANRKILRSLSERNSMRSICRIFQVSMGWLYHFMTAHFEELNDSLQLLNPFGICF